MRTILRTLMRLLMLTIWITVQGAHGESTGDPPSYHLSPGDVIEVSVAPQKDYSRVVTIQPDGKVSYPLAGELQAAGLTVGQLSEKLRGALDRDLKDAVVTGLLNQLNHQAVRRVSVLGAVRSPGVFEIKEGTTAAEVLASAGGPVPLADL